MGAADTRDGQGNCLEAPTAPDTTQEGGCLPYYEGVVDSGVLDEIFQWQGFCLGLTRRGNGLVEPFLGAGLKEFWATREACGRFLSDTCGDATRMEEMAFVAAVYRRLAQASPDDEFCEFLTRNEPTVRAIVDNSGCSPELVFMACGLRIRDEAEKLGLVKLEHATGNMSFGKGNSING